MDEISFIDGAPYITLGRAAKQAGLSADYVARLCKTGEIKSAQSHGDRYVDETSLKEFIIRHDSQLAERSQKMAEERSREYSERNASGIRGTDRMPYAAASTSGILSERIDASPRAPIQGRLQDAVAAKDAERTLGIRVAPNFREQSAAYTPTHKVGPGGDFLRKATALAAACAIVVGTYSVFDPSFARMVYRSGANSLATLSHGVSFVADSAAKFENALKRAVEPGIAAKSADGADNEMVSAGNAAAVGALNPESVSEPNEMPTVQPGNPVATFVPFTGTNVSYGDLIAHDPEKLIYTLTRGSGDVNTFGVVTEEPALLFRPEGKAGDIAVVSAGTTLVNVTLEGGVIAPGDALTPSSIPGKARRAAEGDHVIGTANEDFDGTNGVRLDTPDGSSVLSGTIAVNVSMKNTVTEAAPGTSCTTFSCQIAHAISPEMVYTLLRYLLAALIAVLSIVLAFKSFISDANYGVISMGRNPRASSSIRSMVAFNAFLAFAIASGGLFAAMVVLFAG